MNIKLTVEAENNKQLISGCDHDNKESLWLCKSSSV